MGFFEILDDFAACVAVAGSTAPDEYPRWSGGLKAHVAEMSVLWAEIQPQLRRDVEQARRVESALQEMTSAAKVGDAHGVQQAVRALQGLDVSKLR